MNFDGKILLSCVLVGKFSPLDFHPAWFKANKLVRPDEVVNSKEGFVSPEVTSFNLSLVQITVTPDRFTVQTTDESKYEIARDFVSGVISLCGDEVTIKQFGLNVMVHKKLSNLKKLEEFYENASNSKFIDGFAKGAKARRLGLLLPNAFAKNGFIRVDVEDSLSFTPGVFICVNNHHEASKEQDPSAYTMEVLNKEWDKIFLEEKQILEKIYSQVIN